MHRSAGASGGVSSEPANADQIDLREVGAAIAVCSPLGEIVSASPRARSILADFFIVERMPPSFWNELLSLDAGTETEWHQPESSPSTCLGCTRYSLGRERHLLIMSEVGDKNAERARRLHRQRLESMGRLVTSVAHDLRAPLASIVYNIDVLNTPELVLDRDELRQIAEDMAASVGRLRVTVERLLDFGRIETHPTTEADVEEVIERVEAFVRPTTRAGHHRVVRHVHPAARHVRANAIVVEQVLLNLVLNALESSDEPVVVTITARPGSEAEPCAPQHSSRPAEQFVRVSVADTGRGIPEYLRDRIFHPFFSTKSAGTGLGLTTAREAARELGGDIVLDATHVGTSFTLCLPAVHTEPREPAEESS